ncbi:MAG: hypothetical protein J6W69_03615, partial [Bacteroidales bacterium]|nr:hypothetical protein [Bacteroidales bacterium]
MKNLHTIDPKEKALDRLLADAKAEWDEAWMSEAESHIPRGMEQRLADSLETALKLGEGVVYVQVVDGELLMFSENFACVDCGISLPEIAPRMFS